MVLHAERNTVDRICRDFRGAESMEIRAEGFARIAWKSQQPAPCRLIVIGNLLYLFPRGTRRFISTHNHLWLRWTNGIRRGVNISLRSCEGYDYGLEIEWYLIVHFCCASCRSK